jgi:glutathione S-transferase
MTALTLYHIPVCPFSQRVEILLALKELRDELQFEVIDITRPRPQWLLDKTRGTTALPVLEIENGRIIKESLVILRYLEECHTARRVMQDDPYDRAVEGMMTAMEGDFTSAGYRFVMNQDREARAALHAAMLAQFGKLDASLVQHNVDGTWLFNAFGYAEVVFTPMFMRFWFLEYYEGFELPDTPRYARVRRWRDACLAHPAAQQVTREEIVKLYYDYAHGAGNGALLPGRQQSSFAFDPHWSLRPWPPREKYGSHATDAELGLTASAV